MTCVWNGLIHKLKLNMSPNNLCEKIKKENKITENVSVGGVMLTENQKKENYERVSIISNISNGYDMSTCDPLLILISELYSVNISHKFNQYEISYVNTQATSNIDVCSNNHHFW